MRTSPEDAAEDAARQAQYKQDEEFYGSSSTFRQYVDMGTAIILTAARHPKASISLAGIAAFVLWSQWS